MTRYFNLKKAAKPREASKKTKNVWQAIRHARRFTLVDLVTVTGLTKEVVALILVPWRQAGIVRDDNGGYRLARDLGPAPPFRSQKVAGLISRIDGEILPLESLQKGSAPSKRKAKSKLSDAAAAMPKRVAKSKLSAAAAIVRRRFVNNLYARQNRDRINARRRARRAEQRT